MPLSALFQSNHRDSLHYSCLSWVSPVLGGCSEMSYRGHAHEKPRAPSAARTQGYESNTLGLSNEGPSIDSEILENLVSFTIGNDIHVSIIAADSQSMKCIFYQSQSVQPTLKSKEPTFCRNVQPWL